jgi:hypothetical protein
MIFTCTKLSQTSHGGGEDSHCKALQFGRLMVRKSSAPLQHFRLPCWSSFPTLWREELQKV